MRRGGDDLFVDQLGLARLAHDPGLRGAVNVGIDQADALAQPPKRDREIGGDGRFADPALAAGDRDDGALALLGGHRDLGVGNARHADHRGADPAFEPGALLGRKPGRVEHDGRLAVLEPGHCDPARRGEIAAARGIGDRRQRRQDRVTLVGHWRSIGKAAPLGTVFPPIRFL